MSHGPVVTPAAMGFGGHEGEYKRGQPSETPGRAARSQADKAEYPPVDFGRKIVDGQERRDARGQATVKFIPLIWAGIVRKRSRSILILLQVIIAFTLFGVLQGLNSGIKQAVDGTHADRLYVGSRMQLGNPLPASIVARLATVPGVTASTFRIQFGGFYQRQGQNISIAGTDPATFLPVYPELEVSPKDAVKALQATQDAALVGVETMRTYGWKIGDRVTVQTPIVRKDGTRNWPFEIVGTYRNKDNPESSVILIANYRYINESRGDGRDTILLGTVRIADPTRATVIGDAIDAMFANSPNETLTQSEHELAQSQLSRIGDLDLVVHRITAAAFFVLLFSTGALMMQSIRERTPELAVLKTFGFSDVLVMALILIETIVLCVAGAAVGLWIASRVLVFARAQIGLGSVSDIVMIAGFAIAIGLALAGGAIPAWRGLRLRVVDALADR